MGVLRVIRPEAGEEGFALFDSEPLRIPRCYLYGISLRDWVTGNTSSSPLGGAHAGGNVAIANYL